jgi:hypothetical protein
VHSDGKDESKVVVASPVGGEDWNNVTALRDKQVADEKTRPVGIPLVCFFC